MTFQYLSHLVWNPNRVVFFLPYFNHPIMWYGVLFALGFLVTYFVLKRLFRVEIFSKISLKPNHIENWTLLYEEMARHPHLFAQPIDRSQEGREAILTQIEKTIKLKKLPSIFYQPKFLKTVPFSEKLTDQMTAFIVCGILIGARLGYVFFYGWPLFKNNWIDIFKLWTGGLASHGACVGILLALALFVRKLSKSSFNFSYLYLMDFLAIISGFFAFFIRMGNFVNQEIVGRPTELPWGILFLNPFDSSPLVPRHPVQLYEGLFYLLLALTMFGLWKKNKMPIGQGLFAATFLIALFSFRFLIEFFKEPQGFVLPVFKGLLMGQYLSIPFISVGIWLVVRYFMETRPRKKSLL